MAMFNARAAGGSAKLWRNACSVTAFLIPTASAALWNSATQLTRGHRLAVPGISSTRKT